MGGPSGVTITYDDGNRLEDVMRTVIMLTPTDKPFTTGIGKTRASNTLHQWPEDTATTRSDNAQIEGSAFSYTAKTAPSRIVNITQILDKEFFVSSTERWVKSAGIDDRFLYEKGKALLEIGTDIEHAYLRGSLSSGTGSAARRMAGALNFVTNNATAVASGTKLTESFFVGLAQLAWDDGGRPTEVYCGAFVKRIISGYTAGTTKNTNATDKRLVNAVDIYESDFGVMKIFISRDMLSGANAGSVLLIEPEKFKMAIGEPVMEVPNVAQDSHGTKGVYRYEGTLEVLGERHNALATGLSEKFPS